MQRGTLNDMNSWAKYIYVYCTEKGTADTNESLATFRANEQKATTVHTYNTSTSSEDHFFFGPECRGLPISLPLSFTPEQQYKNRQPCMIINETCAVTFHVLLLKKRLKLEDYKMWPVFRLCDTSLALGYRTYCSFQFRNYLLVGNSSSGLIVVDNLWLLVHFLQWQGVDHFWSIHNWTHTHTHTHTHTVANSFCVYPLAILACCNTLLKSRLTVSSTHTCTWRKYIYIVTGRCVARNGGPHIRWSSSTSLSSLAVSLLVVFCLLLAAPSKQGSKWSQLTKDYLLKKRISIHPNYLL